MPKPTPMPLCIATLVAVPVALALVLAPDLGRAQQLPAVNMKIASLFPFNSPDPQWRAEYVSSRDSHTLGFKHAQEDGYLPNVNISIIERDTTGLGRGDEGRSVYAALDVIKEGVVGILGGGTSTSAAQISMVSRSLKLPLCSMIAGSSILSNKADHPWFFRFLSGSTTIAKSTIDFMTQQGQWRQFSLLTETGNAFTASYSADIVTLAKANGMTILSNTAVGQSNASIAENMPRILDQLTKTRTTVLVYSLWTAEAAKVIQYLHENRWFDTAPPGRPRTLVVINSPVADMITLSPTMAGAVLQKAAWIRIGTTVLDMPTLFPDFQADYQTQTGQSYPHPKLLYFNEAYGCAYAMAAGLHRLAQVSRTTLADVAARSQASFQNMSLSLFNVTNAMKPRPSTSARVQAEFRLDNRGDPIPSYIDIRVIKGNFTATGALFASYEPHLATIPPVDSVKTEPYAFPGLSVGVFPRDSDPEVDLVANWSSAVGITTTACVAVCFALVAISLCLFIYHRDHTVVRKTSIPVLAVFHIVPLLLMTNALLHVDRPTQSTCLARSATSSVGLALFLLVCSVRMFLLWRVTSFRQAVQVQRLIDGPPSSKYRKEVGQSPAGGGFPGRRMSGFRQASRAINSRRLSSGSGTGPPPASAGGTGANTVTVPPTLKEHGPSLSQHKSLTTRVRSVSSMFHRSKNSADQQLALHASQHESMLAVLDGRRPMGIMIYLGMYGGPVALLYAAAMVYHFFTCDMQSVRVRVSESQFEYMCQCKVLGVGFSSWMFVLATHAGLALAIVAFGWQTMHIAFNVHEARRTILATLNAAIGTSIFIFIQYSRPLYPMILFYTLMVTFVATSSMAIYVGPLLMRIHASHKLRRSRSESMVDSNESLSTNRVSPTVAVGSSGNEVTAPLAAGANPASVPGGSGGQSMNRLAAGGDSAALPVPTATTPAPSGGGVGPVKSASALSSIMASSTNSLDAVAFPASPFATSPISEHPPTLSFSGGNPDELGPTIPSEITQLFLRVFQCHARHHLPDFVATHASARRDVRERVQVQWHANKDGKDGVVKEWHKWTRVELWCLYSGEPGVGCVMLQADGVKIESNTLGGPMSAFEVLPVPDVSTVLDPHVKPAPAAPASAAPANAGVLYTRRAQSDNTPGAAASVLPSNMPSPFLILHGLHSRTWILLQFPHARHARRFAGLFAPPRAVQRPEHQGAGGAAGQQGAAGLMSVF